MAHNLANIASHTHGRNINFGILNLKSQFSILDLVLLPARLFRNNCKRPLIAELTDNRKLTNVLGSGETNMALSYIYMCVCVCHRLKHCSTYISGKNHFYIQTLSVFVTIMRANHDYVILRGEFYERHKENVIIIFTLTN